MKTFSDSPIAATGWLCGTAITINLSVLLFLGLNTPLTLPGKLWAIFDILSILCLLSLLCKADMISLQVASFCKIKQRKITALKRDRQYLRFLISVHSQLNLNTSLSDNFHRVFFRLNQFIPFGEVRITLYHPPRKYHFEYPRCPFDINLPRIQKWDLYDRHTFHGMIQIKINQTQILSSYERDLIQSVTDALAKHLSLRNTVHQQIQQGLINERENISRELHDTVAQSFLFLKIQINSLHVCHDKFSRQALIALRIIKEELTLASQQLREMLATLRAEKNHYDLYESLQSLIKEFNHRLGFQIEFYYRLTHQIIPIGHRRHLAQIIREALNNCYKHADASWISIRIYPIGKNIITVISDNGRGIHQEQIKTQFGLAIMRERVTLISGKMKIKKRKQGGTEIEIQVPLQDEQRNIEK